VFGPHKQLGQRGEEAAARHLRKAGYSILARNYVCPHGELDLICHHDDSIVFVEVKTRSHDEAADPEVNVTPAKERQIERVARYWLARHNEPDCAYRFDAVSVVIDQRGEASVRHIIDAFTPAR